MKFIERQYMIAESFLPALINGDVSGLTDREEYELDSFLEDVDCRGHWSVGDEPYEFARCNVTNLMAMCYMVTAHDPLR